MGRRISVLGAGGWGTALAVTLARKGEAPLLWARREEQARELRERRQNTLYLPGIELPESIEITDDLEYAVSDCDILTLTIPSQHVRELCAMIRPLIKGRPLILHGIKGIETDRLKRISEVIEEEIPSEKRRGIVALSGPSHAEEVGAGAPTAVVSASADISVAQEVQEVFMGPTFRVYTNPDIIGVELGGALKNIIAIASGISEGLGYGDNTKAALITRGIAEISRLGIALGARPLTFAGLSGVGDLIVTASSRHSRNLRAGIEIGKGKTLEEILAESRMVVEGVPTCKAAYKLSRIVGVEMPINDKLYSVLYEKQPPRPAVMELMMRGATHEIEEVADGSFPYPLPSRIEE